MRAINIIFIALFLFALQASAQQQWDLKKCLEIGMKNNLDIQLAQLEALRSETTYRSAAAGFLPSVSLGVSHNYSIGSTIDPSTNSRVSSNIQSDNFALGSSVDIINFNHFTVSKRNKIAVLKAKSDKQSVADAYALTILENYFTVIYTQEQLKIQQKQFANAQFNLTRIKKETDIGSKPPSDLYDMQTSYAREENNLIQTVQLLFNEKLKLLQLMNVTNVLPDGIVLEDPAAFADNPTGSGKILSSALLNSAEVRAAQLDIEISRKNTAIERNNYLPVVTASYSYSSFYYFPVSQPGGTTVNPFWAQFNDNKNHFVSMQMAVPVFTGLNTRRGVQLAKVAEQKSVVVAEQEKITLGQTIEQEMARQRQNLELLGKLENTRSYALKSFETTQLKFISGLVDATVFTSSKNELLAAEYDLLKAKFTAGYLSMKLRYLAFNTFQ